MKWTQLPTNYTDAVWNGLRKYVEVANDDGTVSFQDVTVYSNKENSFFGAKEANQMNEAMNLLAANIESTTENAQTASDAATAAKNSETAAANSQSEAASFASDAQSAASTALSKAAAASNSAKAAADYKTTAEISASAARDSADAAAASAELVAVLLYNNAGTHNSIYRGKNLGSAVTAEQYAAIKEGTFDDMYIGDYWVIGDVTYRIAAFDYYLRAGDIDMKTHHVTLVPDANMYTHCMNDTNITTGGYVGSKMYTEGLNQAKTTIKSAFGAAHILTHRQYLCNAVSNGKPSGSSWYNSTVELMTEQNCYGGKVFGVGNDGSNVPALYTVDKSQFPLFTFRPDMISNRQWFWLRDVVSASHFAHVYLNGRAYSDSASRDYGVRPAFSIKS